MLRLAVKAQLPLIAVTTTDTLNVATVIRHLTGRKPVPYTSAGKLERQLYVHPCGGEAVKNLETLYETMVAHESTVILVNPKNRDDLVFDVGPLVTPPELLLEFITTVTSDAAKATTLLPALGGCTLKDVAEYVRLTMARDHTLGLPGLMETRKSVFRPQKGLEQVDPHQAYYEPPAELESWAQAEKPFFLTNTDPRLVPRGLLLDGQPGTGKTEAARYLANQWGVPLYRLDVGGAKNKYLGESQTNLANALARLDQAQPCVALLDEVEKLFSRHTRDNTGTDNDMLANLLWWLAERQTRVLVVLTTNDRSKLPQELYRPGRIDRLMVFHGLDRAAATGFTKRVLATYGGVKIHPATQAKMLDNLYRDATTVAQATLAQLARELVKAALTQG